VVNGYEIDLGKHADDIWRALYQGRTWRMPWTPKDASSKTKKADTPKKSRRWSAVANSALDRTGDEGRAIREANAVVARGKAKRKGGK
jgi:hypothetical protein